MNKSRREAKALGESRYFAGAPCVHGHIARRWTKNGTCEICHAERQSAYVKTERGKAANAKRGVKWREANRVSIRQRCAAFAKEYRRRPEVLIARRSDAWKKRVKEWNRRYNSKPEIREAQRARDRRRYSTDPAYRLAVVLRARLRQAIKNEHKRGSAIRLLGCTIHEARRHIEQLFSPGMSWANHGAWHIDHKRPLASFDLSDQKQMALACHYTNLAPLWALENVLKGARYLGELRVSK